jgi:uncharacterized membrane protein
MRRPAPFLHRFSRPLIGLFAALGVADTAYLTSVKLGGGAAACSSEACNAVLSSPYANILGFPLSLFGLLAYLAMMVMAILPLAISAKSNKKLHNQVQELTWTGLFLGGTAMAVFSGYLMYLLAVVIKSPCPYCIASAAFAGIIFGLVLVGREWEAIGSMITNGLIAGFLVSILLPVCLSLQSHLLVLQKLLPLRQLSHWNLPRYLNGLMVGRLLPSQELVKLLWQNI